MSHHLGTLPVQVTSFVGRERELAAVQGLLARTHLLTLTGSGGCGKTRLALQAPATVLDGFPDGVWFVALAPLTDPSLVPPTVAQTLEIREIPGRLMLTTLVETLRSRHLLLLLDNCEHLIDVCAQVSDALLQTCARVRIIATSREPLGVRGETTMRVPSLALPDLASGSSLDEVRQCEAVRLFVD